MNKHTTAIVRQALDIVRPQFRLPIDHGHHGLQHWVRVWANAEMLCERYAVDPTVPCWFAFLHDSQRCNEDRDPDHGWRAEQFAYQLWDDGRLPITPGERNALGHALHSHSDGFIGTIDRRIEICWDADRLDLGRCGIVPDPRRLCTEHARLPGVIHAAWARSRAGVHRRAA